MPATLVMVPLDGSPAAEAARLDRREQAFAGGRAFAVRRPERGKAERLAR